MNRVNYSNLLLWIWGVGLALSVASSSCGATSQEPCTQKDLAGIVTAHEARLASKCFSQSKDCPERKAEDARFKEEVRAWVRCDTDAP